MAEFSKQYVESYSQDMNWDFDLEKEFTNISGGEYLPMICEGFGFVAISKQLDGSKWCIFRNWQTGETQEVRYEDITDTTHEEIWK